MNSSLCCSIKRIVRVFCFYYFLLILLIWLFPYRISNMLAIDFRVRILIRHIIPAFSNGHLGLLEKRLLIRRIIPTFSNGHLGLLEKRLLSRRIIPIFSNERLGLCLAILLN